MINKKIFSFALALMSLVVLAAQNYKPQTNDEISVAEGDAQSAETNDMSKSISYNLGILVAQNLKQQGLRDINAEEMAAGVADALAGTGEVDLMAANKMVQEFFSQKQAAQFAEVKTAGENFLVENAKRTEVSTTASGLQYEVLKPGSGVKPTTTNKVKVHYHGTTVDGEVFDSSVQRGQPASFGVTQVIQGWVEGLQLMPLGSKYKFFIPYNLAYGEQGAGDKIPPFSALIFEVELLGIE